MKKNPFLIGYTAVTAIGAAALGFLLYTGYGNYSEVRENYESQARRLVSLKNRAPFPSPENNEAYAKLAAEYKTEYEKLLQKISSMQEPLEDVSPSVFQDRLRAVVSEVQAAAAANDVELDPAFYLGFDRYQGALPSDEAAGPLARQLSAIRLVVDQLIEAKVQRIASIRRELLPEESGGAPAEPSPRNTGGRPQQATARSIVSSSPFEIVFVADQGHLRQSLNSIARASQFLVIRSLNLESSAVDGPSRTASVDPTATPTTTGNELDALGIPGLGGEGEAPASTLRVLVGLETLTVGARIEMLTFNLAASKE